MLGAMPPKDPLRKEYPPLPEKGPPFDLDALGRIAKPDPPRFRWRRRKRQAQASEAAPKVTTARSSVALLALIPDPEQCLAFRDALAEAGAPYAMPPRLTLRNGLSLQDEGAWRKAIRAVLSAEHPTVVIHDADHPPYRRAIEDLTNGNVTYSDETPQTAVVR